MLHCQDCSDHCWHWNDSSCCQEWFQKRHNLITGMCKITSWVSTRICNITLFLLLSSANALLFVFSFFLSHHNLNTYFSHGPTCSLSLMKSVCHTMVKSDIWATDGWSLLSQALASDHGICWFHDKGALTRYCRASKSSTCLCIRSTRIYVSAGSRSFIRCSAFIKLSVSWVWAKHFIHLNKLSRCAGAGNSIPSPLSGVCVGFI